MHPNMLINLTGLALWLALQVIAVAAAAMRIAFLRLHAREVMEIDHLDHATAAHWLKGAPQMRAAAVVTHAVCSAGAVVAALWVAQVIHALWPPGGVLPARIVLVTVTIITTGCMPWYLGTYYAHGLVRTCTHAMFAWATVTRYLNLAVLALGRLCAWPLGVRGSILQPFHTEEHDSPLAEISGNAEEIGAEEHEMIKSIFEFGDTIVREVMTPRTAMCAAPASISLRDALALACESGHSRLPVYDATVDKIIGVLYVRDALAHWDARDSASLPALRTIARTPLFVPETKKVNELLRDFRAKRTQLAIIVDEHGGTAGLVTLEDLLEEIVGDIDDEFDQAQPDDYAQTAHDTFELDGSLSVFDVNDSLNLHLPGDQGFDTLAGFIMYKLGRLPDEGEELRLPECILQVLRVEDRRIDRVKITLRAKPAP
jgi:CBS domain containing-hemolysin-like protein